MLASKSLERVVMKFLKENSYDILRLYINQIGITIFSLVLYFSVSMLEDELLSLRLKVTISVFAMLFFFALLYTAAWDWGAKDRIRVDGGKMKPFRAKGALMATFANAINFLFAGVCIISMWLYMRGVEGMLSVSQIFNLLLRLTNAMYLGLLQGIFSAFESQADLYNLLQSVGYFIAPLLAIASTHMGYMFGFNNKRIFPATQKPQNK